MLGVIGIGLRMFFLLVNYCPMADNRPPLVEGHHVAARMKDIVGGRDTSESTQKDRMSLYNLPTSHL